MTARRVLGALLAAAVLAALPIGAYADPPSDDVYLSLGTSLAAGSLADPVGDTTFSSKWSYTDQLYQRIKGRVSPKLTHLKLGCPGETTGQFTGGTNLFGQPSACAGSYESGSQLGDALAAVEAGNVVLVTIDIGANDILQTQQICQGEATCISAVIPVIAQKVAEIMGALRNDGGYTGPIVAMNYYNPQVAAAIGYFPGVAGQQEPDADLALLSDQLTRGFNDALAGVYATADAEVVDVYAALNAGDFGDDMPRNGIADNVDVVCALTSMCPDDVGVKANIHLNEHGYRVVAKAFLEVLTDLED